MIDRAEKLNDLYESRARFAKQVDVEIGKENAINFKNRGYCIATFSTYEECQNFYFSYSGRMKMELMGEKLDF